MKLSKNLLAALAVTTVATGSILGVSAVSAHGNGENKDELVTKLAQKFNIDVSEVESVFEEQRTEMQAERETKRAEHLQGLVDAGTITAEQKTLLETKFDEMKATREALRDQDLTREERHEKMEEARESFEAWANEQGIDLEAIHPEGGPEGQKGGRGHGMRD